AQMAIRLDDRIFNRILAVVMLAVMGYTFLGRERAPAEAQAASSGGREKAVSAIAFFFLGIYGGFIQAGIGFLILAALSLIKNYDLVTANAVKVYVVLLYTVVAIVAFVVAGKVDWPLGLVLAAGNAAGGWMGGHFAVLKGSKAIRWVLLACVVAFSIKLLLP
ncbi:MAG: sulfite exporter TauE/SafE family protein, partial [Acidobacteria bacterium]|nr:sulfite exporter TauE/SafE family protein [Acidobacteriota bacterium]